MSKRKFQKNDLCVIIKSRFEENLGTFLTILNPVSTEEFGKVWSFHKASRPIMFATFEMGAIQTAVETTADNNAHVSEDGIQLILGEPVLEFKEVEVEA